MTSSGAFPQFILKLASLTGTGVRGLYLRALPHQQDKQSVNNGACFSEKTSEKLKKKIKMSFMYGFVLKSFLVTPGRAANWNPSLSTSFDIKLLFITLTFEKTPAVSGSAVRALQ